MVARMVFRLPGTPDVSTSGTRARCSGLLRSRQSRPSVDGLCLGTIPLRGTVAADLLCHSAPVEVLATRSCGRSSAFTLDFDELPLWLGIRELSVGRERSLHPVDCEPFL